MVVGGVKRRSKRRGINHRSRRIELPLSTNLWRLVTRRILENSVQVNDTDRALDDDSRLDRSLELMVGTAPFSQIRANPMAWTLFMRGFEVGRYLTQMTVDDLQQNHDQDLREFQSAVPRQNQMTEESTSSVMTSVVRDTLAEMEEIVSLSIDDPLSPWLEEILALMEENQSTSTEAEQVHAPAAVEDSTSTDYEFFFDDDDLEL